MQEQTNKEYEVTSIRFGNYAKEVQANYSNLSYNEITRSPKHKIGLRLVDLYRLVVPYIKVRFVEQFKAVAPLALYMVLFQLFVLHQNINDALTITAGLSAVVIGLMFFMEGIKVGLMPLGETIGNTLPKKASLSVVLVITFILGIGVTFAEPAIGALKAAGSLVQVESAPYLYAMLNFYSEWLVLVVGIGVGIAAVLGTIRFLKGWSLKPYIYLALIPTMALTIYLMSNSDLTPVLGLAWDSGAVTTGPVTVPLVLALGIGIAHAAGKSNSALSGFGVVTLASLFPIIAVMILAIILHNSVSIEDIYYMAQHQEHIGATAAAWYNTTPGEEIALGLRAIVPLVLFLFLVLRIVLKSRLQKRMFIFYGVGLSIIGMIIFNIGLTYGLAKLGGQAGGFIPNAFASITVADGTVLSALYPYAIGLGVALLFAYILGFGATLAEPALNALGMTVENLTQGVFKKRTLIYAVSVGVGAGIAIGIVKIIFDLPLGYLLLAFYAVALVLTYLSDETYVNIAWDSAGVTTGPITVPLVLAMGLGFGNAVHATEGFGILSMASIGPIIAVLATGLWVNYKEKKGEVVNEKA